MSRRKLRKSGSSPKRPRIARKHPSTGAAQDELQRAVLTHFFEIMSRKAVGTPEVPPADADPTYWDALRMALSTMAANPLPIAVRERMHLSHMTPEEELAWREQWAAELEECLSNQPGSEAGERAVDEAFERALAGEKVPDELVERVYALCLIDAMERKCDGKPLRSDIPNGSLYWRALGQLRDEVLGTAFPPEVRRSMQLEQLTEHEEQEFRAEWRAELDALLQRA